MRHSAALRGKALEGFFETPSRFSITSGYPAKRVWVRGVSTSRLHAGGARLVCLTCGGPPLCSIWRLGSYPATTPPQKPPLAPTIISSRPLASPPLVHELALYHNLSAPLQYTN